MADAAQSYPSSGQANYEAGLRCARYAAGVGALESLFDQHFASFGYPADHFKRVTLQGLRDRVSWQAALDFLVRAVSLDPAAVLWRHQLALVLEQVGRIEDALMVRQAIARLDPHSLENNDGIGRLCERTEPADEASTLPSFSERHYALVARSVPHYLLAMARYAALRGLHVLKGTTFESLKVRVHGALTFSPNDVALNLAMGFVHLAEKDSDAARRKFLAASLLADQSTSSADKCDQWSLAYAQAFLLGLIPRDAPPGGALPTVDPTNLLLARASLLRREGATFAALSEYAAAVARLLPSRLPSTFHVYRGYKIVYHDRCFYAVPEAVVDFSFFHGSVVRAPAFVNEPALLMRSMLAARLSAGVRAQLKALLQWFQQSRIVRHIAQISGARFAARRLRRLAERMYIRRYAVAGVMTDTEVSALRARIDSSQHDTRQETDRVAARDLVASG
jgi:hypothetical protein